MNELWCSFRDRFEDSRNHLALFNTYSYTIEPSIFGYLVFSIVVLTAATVDAKSRYICMMSHAMLSTCGIAFRLE